MNLRLPRWRFRRQPTVAPARALVELRVGDATFAAIRSHLENTTQGEEAAFLLCGVTAIDGVYVLLVREWVPVPMSAKVRSHEFGLEWTPAFSAEVLDRADRRGAAVVLMHSHGTSTSPELSVPDKKTSRSLLPGFSRVLAKPCGSVVLGGHAASGVFWRDGRAYGELARLRIVGAPIDVWEPKSALTTAPVPRRRHARTILAIGPEAEAKLAAASIAVIGVCGGGSHVCQQLAHLGVGRIVPIDADVVEDVNLGRMVGTTPTDAGKTRKTDVMARLIRSIDPGITVVPVPYNVPTPETLAALRRVDLVVACVDSFLVRAVINTFCRRHHIPLIDIGLVIETKGQQLLSAHGQLVVVTPDSGCLRCGPLLSDEALEKERKDRPPGYDRNPNAPGEAQVVSMNGVLASEAVNTVLDFVTGYARGKRGPGWWLYDGRGGTLTKFPAVERRAACPACAEAGHGDPSLPPVTGRVGGSV